MTPAELISAAITATAVGDYTTINELYAADCSGVTPTMQITSRAQLIDEVAEQAGVLSDVTVEVTPVETVNGSVAAEWRLTGRHTGSLVVDDEQISPTGTTVALQGAIFATVSGGRIMSFRQYWSEIDLLEQFGLMEAAQ
jgi:ketosteroid isomerase-like protein